eukprot:m.128488 g.128488  ORF g.128488 m.128488 type:complete len:470 (-) comp19897_c0_seq2:106-1515(-)
MLHYRAQFHWAASESRSSCRPQSPCGQRCCRPHSGTPCPPAPTECPPACLCLRRPIAPPAPRTPCWRSSHRPRDKKKRPFCTMREKEKLPCEAMTKHVTAFANTFVDYVCSGHVWRRPAAIRFARSNIILHEQWSQPQAARLVAIGDLHGDFDKTYRSFELAGLVKDFRWTGGKTVCVQVGDQLDRGGQEIKILLFLEKLKYEAHVAGGALHVINGNHETMNVAGRFRYSTRAGCAEFDRWYRWFSWGRGFKAQAHPPAPTSTSSSLTSPAVATSHTLLRDPHRTVPRKLPADKHCRFYGLRSGGPLTRRFLATQNIILGVGSSLFVHGGVLPDHVGHFEEINSANAEWMAGRDGVHMPGFLKHRDSPVWARNYSTPHDEGLDCEMLHDVLNRVGYSHMIMGHTIQKQGINAVCGMKSLRIDVGISEGCIDGQPQALEILNGKVLHVLTERGRVPLQVDVQTAATAAQR